MERGESEKVATEDFSEIFARLRSLRAAAQQQADQEALARAVRNLNIGPRSVERFLAEHGRFPRLGDDVPPWQYFGWLRPYVQLLHRAGGKETEGFPDRWGYYLRTLEAGQLLDEPIPLVEFQSCDRAVLSETAKWVQILDADGGGHNSLSLLAEFLGFGLGVHEERPARISERAAERLYREVRLQRWLARPADYLGALAEEQNYGRGSCFFSTPQDLVSLMCRMTMGEPGAEDKRLTSISEPCLGPGKILLEASNYSMNCTGNDINGTLLLMAKVNFAVYAPWVLYGLPWAAVQRRRALAFGGEGEAGSLQDGAGDGELDGSDEATDSDGEDCEPAAAAQHQAPPWSRRQWTPCDIGAYKPMYRMFVEGADLTLTWHGGWQGEVVLDGKRSTVAASRSWPLEQHRRLTYQHALERLRRRHLRPGVPDEASILRYGCHVWIGASPSLVEGRWIFSANQVLRFQSSARAYYQDRDNLASWSFAPVGNDGRSIPAWWEAR